LKIGSHAMGIDALEGDIRKHGFFPPDYTGRWTWDLGRGLWYRWVARSERYEYSNGERMSSTECDKKSRTGACTL
jgi:hypothetical protein